MESTLGEALCTLCSTSFNIARVRTLDEPESASWCSLGPEAWPTAEHQLWPCSTKETGCWYYYREEAQNSTIYQDSQFNPDPDDHLFCDWTKATPPVEGDWLPVDPKFKPKPGAACVHLEDVEHVAGPRCRYPDAYIGNHISVEEMQGCQTLQCLVRKPQRWEPAADDQEIERESDYFLSGICTGVHNREGRALVTPVRHGVPEVGHKCPAIDDFDVDSDELPFHPWCFGTWIKLTRLRLGYVAVNDLVNFFRHRNAQAFMPILSHFKHLSRRWVHTQGEEWLSANPFYVPQLRNFLEEAMSVPPSFSPHDSAFRSSPRASTDIFARLPLELQHMVLEYLPNRDIAFLRQASRTFHHLPVFLWYRLLRRDMPWLWEVWSEDPPYFWATVTEKDLEDHEKEGINIPLLSGPVVRLVVSHTIDIKKHLAPWTFPKPPRYRTNWFMLYRDIKKNWTNLKGLRNRKRIWEFQTQLLDLMSLG